MKKEAKNSRKLSGAYKSPDSFFAQITLALIISGIIFAFSSSTYESYKLTGSLFTFGLKQLISLCCGIILFFLFYKLDYKMWNKVTWLVSISALILMLLTLLTPIGKTIGGSQRWIDLGFIQFQPAEIAKFAVLLLITRQLTRHKWHEKETYYLLGFSILLIFLIFKQPDLGTSVILFLLILILLSIFEWPLWLISLLTVSIGFVCLVKIISTPYQLDRLTFWINPYLEPLGKGYNLIQSKYAFALGGLIGAGLGNSIQKQGYLPIPHADFIFSVIGEEIGFIGVSIILVLFLSWMLRGVYLVNKTSEKYGKVLGTAIIFLISIQAVLNIAVSIGLLPVTGVTLPFFSCGGTSLIVTLAMCGILFSIIRNPL